MNRPEGSSSVMSRRAAPEQALDDTVRAQWRKLDYFATPPWASRAGAEIVRRIDPDVSSVWEPACGDGIMASCLGEYFNVVLTSDIEPQKFVSPITQTVDFLAFRGNRAQADWVITNPPFQHAAEFVRIGLKAARHGVAVLCRLAFLESVDRHDLHFDGDYPLTFLAPFSERVPMQLGPWNPKCSTATAYAWFIYSKRQLYPNADTRIWPIPPGTRTRLTKPDDVARFGPQLEGARS